MKARILARKVTEKLGLHAETLPGITVVELCGDDRVFVENYINVVSFSSETVKLVGSFGVISVCGNSLCLDFLEKDRLLVLGRIECIHVDGVGES